MGKLQITPTEIDGAPAYQVLNSTGAVLVERKSQRAAENYVTKYEAEKAKLAGKRVHVQRPIRGDFEPCYFVEPGGKGIPRDRFERWLSHDVIAPVGDALFPGMTQTYEPTE